MVLACAGLDAGVRQALYRSGVRLVAQPASSQAPLRREPDFVVTPRDSFKRVVVLWIRDASREDAEAGLDANAARENILVLLVTRTKETLRGFVEVQKLALERNVRCIPVTRDLKTLAWALQSLERQGASLRRPPPSKFDLERACVSVPRVGQQTFRDHVEPRAKTLKAVLQITKTSPEPALRPLHEFFTQTL
ncbi:Hypothetical Protein FCC1311_050722 [Hondaea fermentalgiana]|uniref:Uncharacterized protein n=1 Tax=Hondaea fermentalgiana TaxID=2315210 RepID=A0A2R5GKP7_9STRA|nr:Hypothetical Protein FCC1311_050722 [Hondaea fermentalgiana]|eukprot:GBG28851.1 Hypothetical Protein FCC1311_050722 [Hondaea fermentalgiana]